MDEQSRVLCERLANCIVKRDFDGAHALLAPWIRSSLGPTQIQQMVDAAAEGLAHPPHSWTIDEGMADLDELRNPAEYGPPSQRIAKEITGDNFRGWLCIQFAPDPAVQEEQNVCYDLWMIAVNHDGTALAGYLEAAEPS